jgi:hypothetical protein
MREKLKRLDPTRIRALLLNSDQRELVLKINEMVERVNEIEEQLASVKGEKNWELIPER